MRPYIVNDHTNVILSMLDVQFIQTNKQTSLKSHESAIIITVQLILYDTLSNTSRTLS